MDRWQPPPKPLIIATALTLAGSWLLWLSLVAVEPLPAYGPPPAWMRSSVAPDTRSASTERPTASRPPTPASPPFVSIGTPAWAFVNDPCTSWKEPATGVFRHPRCPVAPTPGPHDGMGGG